MFGLRQSPTDADSFTGTKWHQKWHQESAQLAGASPCILRRFQHPAVSRNRAGALLARFGRGKYQVGL